VELHLRRRRLPAIVNLPLPSEALTSLSRAEAGIQKLIHQQRQAIGHGLAGDAAAKPIPAAAAALPIQRRALVRRRVAAKSIAPARETARGKKYARSERAGGFPERKNFGRMDR